MDLKKLSDAVDKKIVEKDVYNAKTKDIEDKIPDITNVPTSASLNAKINKVKNEIPSITNLATTSVLNAKINEVKIKIHNITNLATNISLTAVKNKIPDHSKHITTPEFNKLAQANVGSKHDIANFKDI